MLNVDASGDSTATPVDVVYKVTIDACSKAFVDIVNEIEDFVYSTSQGALTVPSPFESSIATCPLVFSFSVSEDFNRPFDNGIFSFLHGTGGLVINTNNVAYDGYRFAVTLTARVEGYPNT